MAVALREKQKCEYLDKNDELIIEKVMYNYIKSHSKYIMDYISEFTLDNFSKLEFDYFQMFDNSIVRDYNVNSVNIFYTVDKYCSDNGIYYPSPKLRNSMYDIMKNIYKEFSKEFKYKKIVDKRVEILLKDLFLKNKREFRKFVTDNDEFFNAKIKKLVQNLDRVNKFNII